MVDLFLLITASFLAWFYLNRNKQPVFSLADAWAPALPLAQMSARLGCFFSGCCYGLPLQNAGINQLQGRVPVALVEAASMLLLSLYLFKVKTKFEGERFLRFAIGYASLRFFIEFLRGDPSPVYFQYLRSNHFSALALLLISAYAWRVLSRK